MPRPLAIVLICLAALGTTSCSRAPKGPLLAGGREVKSWVEALKDRDPARRRVAVLKLGNVGDADPTVADGLATAIQDLDAQVRRDAVLAAAKLKSPGEPIMTQLRTMSEVDPDLRARDLARRAVARLTAGRG